MISAVAGAERLDNWPERLDNGREWLDNCREWLDNCPERRDNPPDSGQRSQSGLSVPVASRPNTSRPSAIR